METSPGKNLSDLLFSQTREESFELTDYGPNETRKFINRLGKLNQCILSLFIETLHSGNNGQFS
jgi:hypothetical protein